jgi:hypothetical protein
MHRVITITFLLILGANGACGERRPETPTSATLPPPVSPVPPPPAPLILYHLTG